MRVLLYNFRQPEEPGTGGVGIYLKNLADALAGDGHQVITMSSGDRDTMLDRAPRLVFGSDGHDRAIVLNSPVLAPALYSFAEPNTYADSDALDGIPAALRDRYGDIDVFHFQNIEGLTRSFFHTLRAVFPDARIIYSVHNYHLMCSRVTLWYQDRTTCEDYHSGIACTLCRAPVFDPERVRSGRRLVSIQAARPLGPLLSPVIRWLKAGRRIVRGGRDQVSSEGKALQEARLASPASYARFRHVNIELCATVFDRVLAVSERTRQVIVGLGAPADKIAVSYIGTAHKAAYLESTKIGDIDDGPHLGYIGYMTRDKGFEFLLECLERMPADLAATITVTIAARNTDADGYARIDALRLKLRKMRYFNGYTHDNLDMVLEGVNLGLIPVLWEDNLPQTAIELVSRGIPILTSDRGGAQEIAGNPAFVFPAGDHEAFIERLRRIADRSLPLERFWAGPMRIYSMDEHVADLVRHYRPNAGDGVAATIGGFAVDRGETARAE